MKTDNGTLPTFRCNSFDEEEELGWQAEQENKNVKAVNFVNMPPPEGVIQPKSQKAKDRY